MLCASSNGPGENRDEMNSGCGVMCFYFTCATGTFLPHHCWTATPWKHLIADPPCAGWGSICLIGFERTTLCFQVSLQISVWSTLSPVTPAQLFRRPQRRYCIVHTSAPPPRCFYGLSYTSVHPCCPYARACVQYWSLVFNFGWMARLSPPVCCPPPLHPSTGSKWSSPHSSSDNLF